MYSAMRLLILLDPLMLSFVVAPELIAQYTYYWLPANYLVLFLWKFPENLQPFLIKNFAANALDQNRALYRKLTQRTLSLAVVVAVLYVLILPTFLKLWVGVHNTELWASVVFALLIVCLVSYRGDIAVLYSRLNYRALFLLSFAELLVKVVVVVVFYERLSFMVTAVGHLIAHLLVVQLCAKVLSFRELRRVRLT